MKKVGIIHSGIVTYDAIKTEFQKLDPTIELVNIIDDSLLNETISCKGITKAVIARMSQYALSCQAQGCQILLNQCSSIAQGVDVIEEMLDIPYVKIDQPMAKKAVELGYKIALVATVETTLLPSENLLKEEARKLGKEVEITRFLADGVLETYLKNKNIEEHNLAIMKVIEQASLQNDVIVLAQGSMHTLIPLCKGIKIPVLTSLHLGVEQIINYFKEDNQ